MLQEEKTHIVNSYQLCMVKVLLFPLAIEDGYFFFRWSVRGCPHHTMVQNSLKMLHQILHYAMSSEASEDRNFRSRYGNIKKF